jgi:hypothetical protein
MVEVLRLCDFGDEARDIEHEWEMLTGEAGFSPGAPYRRCFPRALLRQTSAQLLKGFREVGLNVATPHTLAPVGARLAEAWERFAEDDAEGYRHWELDTGKDLFSD